MKRCQQTQPAGGPPLTGPGSRRRFQRLEPGRAAFSNRWKSVATLLLWPLLSVAAAEPWWRTATPVASVRLGETNPATIAAGAARGVDVLGWYGFWYLDEVEQHRTYTALRTQLDRAGMKHVMYYDLGEAGDFAGFFAPDGRMVRNGWSLPWWDGREPLTARWFGLDAFMRDVPWAPFPTAKAYDLPAFTTPEGASAADLYATLTRRGLDGDWSFDFSSNERITDDVAERSGLARLGTRQTNRVDMQGRNGWQTVRLVSVDFANPQFRDYCCREIERLIPRLRPDGIHADNFGDNNLGYANQSAFGLWSVHSFRTFLRERLTREERAEMGVADPATFDIAAYIRDKPLASHGRPWHALNPAWTTDPVWSCYRIHLVEQSLAFHRAFYAASKQAAGRAGLDCAVFGNTIPFPLGGTLMKGACDIAHFEWNTVHPHWGMKPMGLPPRGRVGYVTRLGAAISDAPFCWPSIYVSKGHAGPGHENLHKALAFDCLANRALPDFGHWYLDGYSPGTPESAGFVNRFVRANAALLGRREYVADVAVVHSAWSEIASCTVFNPAMDQFVDEYCGWCDFLGRTHRQWDVVLQQDLSATNLARFPVVVLPSVLALSDADIGELRRYVAGGGRLVATGGTGTRFGPERLLRPREQPFAIAGAHIATNKPGVAYWRNGGDAGAADALAGLLAFTNLEPRLTTAAPPTVGVNLNLGAGAAGPVLTLDLNNVDIDVATDAIRAAPSFRTSIRLPAGLTDRAVKVTSLQPGQPDIEWAPDQFNLDRKHGRLDILTPPFDTALIIRIEPQPE